MRAFIPLAALFALLQSGLADAANDSVSEQLARQGHPHTKMCNIPNSSLGLGRLPFIQFERRADSSADRAEAIAILKLLADALVDAGVHYVGLEASRKWDTCQTRDPEYLFWRDQDDNWRYMNERPVRYLAHFEAALPDEQRGTAVEAYVLWSLAVVQQRTDRREASLANLEKAERILARVGDPNEILPFVLMPLIHHHLGEEGDPARGQVYLERYALISESSSAEGNYLPLIKVPPKYPGHAWQRGIQGYVLLEFVVGADGRVRDPVVIDESPKGVFGKAAREAAVEFRYVPRVVDGKLVSTAGVRNRITFELAN